MARLFPFPDDLPLSMQIRSLGDEELLDFWEETQFVERALADADDDLPPSGHVEYERVILRELMLRTCLRTLDSGR